MDTRVLFSLYVPDTNTAAAVSKARSAPRPLLCSDFAEFEFAKALSLQAFRRELATPEIRKVLSLFHQDLEKAPLRYVFIPSAAFQRTKDIAREYTPGFRARSLDILHVASALAFGATHFITFDQRQAALASSLDLRSS